MSPHFLIVLDLGGWVLLVDPNHLRLLQPVGASEDTVMVASDLISQPSPAHADLASIESPLPVSSHVSETPKGGCAQQQV